MSDGLESAAKPQVARFAESRRLLLPAALITLAYIITRAGGLSRELVSEEGMFLMPGRVFFETGRFSLYHKPPLTSLLLGAFSYLGGADPFVGGRLVPFFTGLLVCLVPAALTRSWTIGVIALSAPFLFAACSHMQTDPTVGLIGYLLICCGLWSWGRSDGQRGAAPLVAGFLILWCGKLEIAVIAACAVAMTALMKPPLWRRFVAVVVIGNISGIVLFVILTAALGATDGRSVDESVGEVVGTVTRISADLVSADAVSQVPKRLLLWRALSAFRADLLFAILLLPLLVEIIRPQNRERRSAFERWALLPLAFLPIVIYFVGAYAGDGFPRYFLIVFPPLLVLAGDRLNNFVPPLRTLSAVILLALTILLLVPETYALWSSPGSVNVNRGVEGYRRAAWFVAAHTEPGDLILAPEAAIYYVPGRRWLVHESFVPYPWLYARAMAAAPDIRAAIIPPLTGRGHRETILGRVIEPLEEAGAKRHIIGSFEVLVLDSNRPAVRR